MPKASSPDVNVKSDNGLAEHFFGGEKVKAEQDGVTGEGHSYRSGHEGRTEATQKAAEVINAKKAANEKDD